LSFGFSFLAHLPHLWLVALGPDFLDPVEHVVDRLVHAVVPAFRTALSGGILNGNRPSRTKTVPTTRFESSSGFPLWAQHRTLISDLLQLNLKPAFCSAAGNTGAATSTFVSVSVAIETSFPSPMIQGRRPKIKRTWLNCSNFGQQVRVSM